MAWDYWLPTIIGVLALVAVGLYFWEEKKRARAIKAFSYQHGYEYKAEMSDSEKQIIESLSIFQITTDR